MTIYRYITTGNSSAGVLSISTLNIRGGLCRQLFIQSSTASTTFKANVTDDDSLTVRAFGTVTQTINQTNDPLPMQGTYTVQVTGASADGRFTVLMLIEE